MRRVVPIINNMEEEHNINELRRAERFHLMFDIGSFQNQERQLFVLYAFCWKEFSPEEKVQCQLRLKLLEEKQRKRISRGSDISKSDKKEIFSIQRELELNGKATDIFIG